MRKEGEEEEVQEATEEHREVQSVEVVCWWDTWGGGGGGGAEGSCRLPLRSPLELQLDSPHGRGSRGERRPFFSAGPPSLMQ